MNVYENNYGTLELAVKIFHEWDIDVQCDIKRDKKKK